MDRNLQYLGNGVGPGIGALLCSLDPMYRGEIIRLLVISDLKSL